MDQDQNMNTLSTPAGASPSSGLPTGPSKKRWLKPAIIIGTVVALAIIGAIILLVKNRSSDEPAKQNGSTTITGSKNFKMTTGDKAATYAGNPVYDPCGLVSFDTIRSTVKGYQTILDMNGTDKKPSDTLSIEHNYIDRDIAQPLGKDGVSRPTGTTIGGDPNAGRDASAFVSNFDASCWYGQGSDLSIGSGKIFAKVHVTQKPTPLSTDFTAYLAGLAKTASEGDIDIYVEPKTDGGNFFTGIVTNTSKGVAVIVKGSTRDLTSKMTIDVGNALAVAAKGPMNLTYPLAWVSMPNPCTLLTADDFRRATGKPASAVTNDIMLLNEVGGRLMQRACERLEVERLDNTPIAESNITIRLGATEQAAKDYVSTLKGNKNDAFEIQPLKQKIGLADDAYIKVVKDGDKTVAYEFDMRIGAAVIVLSVQTDNGLDASADAFAGRMLPIAQSVAVKYKQ
jgi:hypothetical protein